MLGFLKKILPSKQDKDIKSLLPIADEVNEVYATLQGISDDELRGKTVSLKSIFL